MRLVGALLLAAILAGPAYGQTKSELSCGALKAESWKTAATSHWTIAGPQEKTTETGALKSGPRFECLEGAVLAVEFTSSAGHSIFTAYFPDGTNIAYGRQQIDRRGGRIVLPIQAKARIAGPYRAAFDYHCRLDMPADPIRPATRADCLF
ncbi:MAG: hypothetical protein Q8N31_08355 [Reyranella sp.]|nr:hypothetical protein [Reyranella sp.]MDP3160012.1 hypothetical protein [Reyranella sp.]